MSDVDDISLAFNKAKDGIRCAEALCGGESANQIAFGESKSYAESLRTVLLSLPELADVMREATSTEGDDQ